MNIQNFFLIGYLACLLFLITGAYSGYRATQKIIETSSWVAHTYNVEALIGSAITQLADAETGQRGYLLTGNTALSGTVRAWHIRYRSCPSKGKKLDH